MPIIFLSWYKAVSAVPYKTALNSESFEHVVSRVAMDRHGDVFSSRELYTITRIRRYCGI
jgi:hypothetical protein